MVVTRLNAIYALLYLIVSLLAVAVIFFVIGAPFVAALEVRLEPVLQAKYDSLPELKPAR